MYKYAFPRCSTEKDRICLACNEEYSAMAGDLNGSVCPNCFSEDTEELE